MTDAETGAIVVIIGAVVTIILMLILGLMYHGVTFNGFSIFPADKNKAKVTQ